MIGTKGVAWDMKKICSGARRDEGTKWFTELADKGKHDKRVTKKTKKNYFHHHHHHAMLYGIIYNGFFLSQPRPQKHTSIGPCETTMVQKLDFNNIC